MKDKQAREDISKLRKEVSEDLKRGTEIMTRHSEKLAELKQYAECESCGCLVNKEKATMKQEMRDKDYDSNSALIFYSLVFEPNKVGEKVIVKVYTCPRCLKSKKK